MVNKRKTTDYLKSNLQQIGDKINEYLSWLESQGRTERAVEDARSRLHSFFMRAPYTEPSAELFELVKKEMESDGISAKHTRQRLYTAGEFYERFYGVNPYRETTDAIFKVWYAIPETEFPFPEELGEYLQYLDTDGLGKQSLSRARFYIEKCCSILVYEGRIREIGDIDADCVRLLASKYLGNTSVKTVERIMCALGGFVEYFANRNPVSEYKDELRVRDEMENTPQWREFHRLLGEFMEDQAERGLTEWSMRSIQANIKTAIKRLFVVCGPLYPDEVTKHHFREVRKNCPDLKDKTIKVYLCKLGLMIKFGTGHDPFNEADMLWGKSEVERTWIFKDQWKSMVGVADPTEKVILYLGAGLGLRRDEIANIKLSDFRDGKVLISGKGHGKGKLVEKEVPRSVQRVIEEYLPVREELIARYGDRNNGSLIAIPFRSHSPTAATRFVDETMRKLKGKTEIDATCHTLRRFYCTNLADAGTELDTLRRMMRHSHIDTTVNHYLKADPRKMKSATTAVDDALDL